MLITYLIPKKPYIYWLVTLQAQACFSLPEAISVLIRTQKHTNNHSHTQQPHHYTTRSDTVQLLGILPKLF
jgi:hypothetical protein